MSLHSPRADTPDTAGRRLGPTVQPAAGVRASFSTLSTEPEARGNFGATVT